MVINAPKRRLNLGDRHEEVKNLHNYLQMFGYMASDRREIMGSKINLSLASPQPEEENLFDSNTQNAVKKFQEFNKLPITGTLDKATLNLMSRPRCGVPDIVEGEQTDYNIVGRWSKTDLTYEFQNITDDLSHDVAKKAVVDAYNKWSSQSRLNFKETLFGSGDIKISWQVGDHGDGDPFDGPLGILAHGFFPEDGKLHFDDDENWTIDDPPTGIDLASVAVHEIGHTLGLGHSTDLNAVMYAYYSNIRRNLQPDDIAGIQAIYGRRR